MTSEAKRAANRANAQKSTGPKSIAGKRKAAKNAFRHGLRARFGVSALDRETAKLSSQLLQDDPDLGSLVADRLAEAMMLQDKIALQRERWIEDEIAKQDSSLPIELREDLARLALLPRFLALDDLDRRAAATIRKQIRKLCDD